jgi:hypothetical protein
MTQANVLSQIGATSGPTFRNRIINGDMYVAQRATSATLTAGGTIANGYATVDRFYGYCTGANVTMAQVSGTGNNRNLLQFTGAASVTAIGCGQRIESLNSYDMAGSTATLSVFIANSLLTTVTWTAYYANTTDTFGTLASPTRTQIATGTFTVTSTLTQYTAQIAIPAAATTGIEIVFTVGAQTSGTWQLTKVQLEAGTSATGFEYEDYTLLLTKCQRYFYVEPIITGNYDGWTSYLGGSFSVRPSKTIQVTMRTSPTLAFSSSGNFTYYNGSSFVAATPVANGTSPQAVNIYAPASATPGLLVQISSGTFNILASAEL